MKKLFFYFSLIILTSFIFVNLTEQASAKSYACKDPNAKWNRDYTAWTNYGSFKLEAFPVLSETFKCYDYVAGDDANYSIISPNSAGVQGGSHKCENAVGRGTENENDCTALGARCMRKADCKEIGGKCINNNTFTNLDCATGIFTYQGKKWRLIRFRCPSFNNSTCMVEVPEIPQKKDPVKSTVPTPTPPVEAITLSDCCKQIVPDIGDPRVNSYSLNHLVQVAVNIYECILCIVGALILMMLVAGAFILMTSAGSDIRVGLGKQIISGAIIGGIIVFFSYLIINFTVKALGAKFNNENRVQINPQG